MEKNLTDLGALLPDLINLHKMPAKDWWVGCHPMILSSNFLIITLNDKRHVVLHSVNVSASSFAIMLT